MNEYTEKLTDAAEGLILTLRAERLTQMLRKLALTTAGRP
jgi:hypothetical protein